jgi:hypothetical protein
LQGAYVIAFLGCILNLIEAFLSFWPQSGSHEQSVVSGVVRKSVNLNSYNIFLTYKMYILSAIMYLSIIAAQKQRRPGFYVPYLVFMVGKYL